MGSKPDSPISSFGLSEQKFEDEVKEYLGTPYRRGGTTRKGMDCSGFARMVYDRLLGLQLPHSSGDQFRSTELQKIDTRELQTGDLVFFANNRKKKRINHVGVYLSDGEFIHASSSEGVIVSSLKEKYWSKRFVGSKRHTALSSAGNGDQFQLENYVAIPVQPDGLFTYYGRDQFNTHSPFQASPETITGDPFERLDEPSAPLSFHEIGYSQNLTDGFDINFHAFTETFAVDEAWPGAGKKSDNSGFGLDSSSPTSFRQGFTLSSDYRPSSWISFTPSVTCFDHSGDTEHLVHVPRRTFGLNTQLTPADSGWSLSMRLRYTDGEDLTSLTRFNNEISSLDMAVKLGITLTENLQFSIMSNHDSGSMSLGMTEDSSTGFLASRDVAMVFDFSY